MRNFVTILTSFGCASIAMISWTIASAHDLPASAHPATAESEEIERLLASQLDSSPAKAKLFSYVAKKLTWSPQTLAACFWNGDTALRSKIAGYADKVAALTPVKFSWGNGGTFRDCPKDIYGAYPVRISLTNNPSLLSAGDHPEDYFTSIGRSILNDTRLATVNLPFPDHANDALYAEKSLHEFCHVLGCLHEHQRGLCDKDFKKQHIMDIYGYTEEQYAANFTEIPTSNAYYEPVSLGTFHKNSIMLYSIPEDYFWNPATSPCYRKNPVTELSSNDKAGLISAYKATVDPRLKTAADFERLTAELDTKVLQYVAQAQAFRTTASEWTKITPLLADPKRNEALTVFARFAKDADDKAALAKKEADSFRLSRDVQALLSKFDARLPKDN